MVQNSWTRFGSTRFMVNMIWTRIGSISKQIYMCFGHNNAGPFISCIKENKELACYYHKERSCMGFYQIKETIICANEIISKTETLAMYCIFQSYNSFYVHASATLHEKWSCTSTQNLAYSTAVMYPVPK